jgi:tetratricopeptide (TPR) repeat protein
MVLLSNLSKEHSNVTGKALLCICLWLGAATAMMGQSRQENVNRCQSGDPDTKIVGCTALIQAGQDTPEKQSMIYSDRGTAYYNKGDYDRAIQDYNQGISLNQHETSLYVDRGDAYKKKRDYDRAIQDFNEAIHLNPNSERAFYDRGGAYIGKDDLDRAIQDYTQAIRLDPNLTNAYGSRGDAYFAQSNTTAAIADLRYTIFAAPSSRTAVYAALTLHLIMKRQGRDDAQQLAQVAAVADMSKWPAPVVKLDLGQMTAYEVMTAAADLDSDRQKWQVCEANYFTGEDALFHHQRATALARLKAARDGCPKGDTMYAAAAAELKRLGAPAVSAK